jgi:hypothetical protein
MTLLLLLLLLMLLRWLCNYITSGQQRQGIIVNLKRVSSNSMQSHGYGRQRYGMRKLREDPASLHNSSDQNVRSSAIICILGDDTSDHEDAPCKGLELEHDISPRGNDRMCAADTDGFLCVGCIVIAELGVFSQCDVTVV